VAYVQRPNTPVPGITSFNRRDTRIILRFLGTVVPARRANNEVVRQREASNEGGNLQITL